MWFRALPAAMVLATTQFAAAAESVVQVISQRPGNVDAAPYADFTKRTGIKVVFLPNQSGSAVAALSASPRGPGDVLIGTDVAGLYPIEQTGVLEPYVARTGAPMPDYLRHPKNLWTAVTTRARVIYVNAGLADPPSSFGDLADPRFRGKICISSGATPYNLSVIGRMIVHRGEDAALSWAKGLVANLAPDVAPGRDGDMIFAVAEGRCAVTLGNHYDYLGMEGPDATDAQKAALTSIRLVWPDQGEGQAGALVNITAVGLLRGAPNAEAAKSLIDHLATPEAQAALAGMVFMPAGGGAPSDKVRAMGSPRWDKQNVAAIGATRPAAERIVKEANWPSPKR